jgi:two-component system LytT family response regulator
MIKALIVEDEKPAARQLKSLLGQIHQKIEVIKIIDNTEDLFHFLDAETHPDVIFSDIQLGDGLSFEAYEKLQDVPPIIFTTAYDEYAIKAFQWNSIDYLVKPIQAEAIQKAVDKFEKLNSSAKIDFSLLLQNLQQSHSENDKLLIHKGSQMLAINKPEIMVIYTENKLVYVRQKKETYVVHQTLDELENELDNSLFFRINRQTLVNKNFIEKAEPTLDNGLRLFLPQKTDVDIKVSRRRVADFKQWWVGKR